MSEVISAVRPRPMTALEDRAATGPGFPPLDPDAQPIHNAMAARELAIRYVNRVFDFWDDSRHRAIDPGGDTVLMFDGCDFGTPAEFVRPAAAVSLEAMVAEVFHGWGITSEWIYKSGCLGPGLSSCPYIPNAAKMLQRVRRHLNVIEALAALETDQ